MFQFIAFQQFHRINVRNHLSIFEHYSDGVRVFIGFIRGRILTIWGNIVLTNFSFVGCVAFESIFRFPIFFFIDDNNWWKWSVPVVWVISEINGRFEKRQGYDVMNVHIVWKF